MSSECAFISHLVATMTLYSSNFLGVKAKESVDELDRWDHIILRVFRSQETLHDKKAIIQTLCSKMARSKYISGSPKT